MPGCPEGAFCRRRENGVDQGQYAIRKGGRPPHVNGGTVSEGGHFSRGSFAALPALHHFDVH